MKVKPAQAKNPIVPSSFMSNELAPSNNGGATATRTKSGHSLLQVASTAPTTISALAAAAAPPMRSNTANEAPESPAPIQKNSAAIATRSSKTMLTRVATSFLATLLTPELSRSALRPRRCDNLPNNSAAAKRSRLERIVRPLASSQLPSEASQVPQQPGNARSHFRDRC